MTPAILAILAYSFVGILIGMLAWCEFDSACGWEREAPALGFLGGLLWPLTISAAVAYGLCVVGRRIVRSFAYLLGRR